MTVGERDPGTWPVGPVLENQRKKLGLSLDDVAKRSNLGRGTVRYYETGFRNDNGAPVNPTAKILRPLAEALELDVDEVFRLAGLQVAPRQPKEDAAEAQRRSAHLADRIAQLDPTFRAAVETIVDEYLRAQGYLGDSVTTEAKAGPAEISTADSAAGPDELPLGNHTSDRTQLSS